MSKLALFLIIIVALIALAFGGLAVVLDNPELYRDRITQSVKDETDFELRINGGIDWRFFPPIAINIDDIEIIPPDSDTPLASLKSASVDIKLIPLILGGKVEVDGLSIDGLLVNAKVNKQGVSNWELSSNKTKSDTDNSDNSSAEDSSADDGESGTSLNLDIQSASITNTQINYTDESKNVDYVLTITELSTGALKPGQITDIKGDISFIDKVNKSQGTLNLGGQIGISEDMQELELAQLKIKADYKAEGQADLSPVILLNGTINTQEGQAEFTDSKFSLSDLTVLFSINATNIFDVPGLRGHIEIPAFNARELAEDFEVELPKMTSDSALTKVSMEADISGTTTQVVMNNLKLILDDSTLTGKATATLAKQMGLAFNLNMDAINVSDYMEPTSADAAPTSNEGGPSTPVVDSEVIPVELLSSIDLDGSFSLGKMAYSSYQFTNIKTTLKNRRGSLNLNANANAFDGAISLKTSLTNVKPGRTPKGNNTLSVTGIDISKVADFKAITGTVAMDSTTTFSGNMMSQLLNTLDGNSTFSVMNGTLDVSSIKRAGAMIGTLQGKPNDLATWPDAMPFTQMLGQHTISQGLADGQQFSFNTEILDVDGEGGMDYFANTINYDIRAELKPDPSERFTVNEQLTGIKWPLHCEGNLDAGVAKLCLPNQGSMTALLTEIAKKQLKSKGKEKLLEQVPDEYKETVKGLFKGLFN